MLNLSALVSMPQAEQDLLHESASPDTAAALRREPQMLSLLNTVVIDPIERAHIVPGVSVLVFAVKSAVVSFRRF